MAAPLTRTASDACAVENSSSPTGTVVTESALPVFVRCLWLAGPLTVIVLSGLLTIGPGRQVLLPGLNLPLPETCWTYARLGVDCPGCGLTRGFVHVARGALSTAWGLNPISIPLYLFVMGQIPLASLPWWSTMFGRPGFSQATLRRLGQLNQSAFIGLLLLLLVQWIVRSVGSVLA